MMVRRRQGCCQLTLEVDVERVAGERDTVHKEAGQGRSVVASRELFPRPGEKIERKGRRQRKLKSLLLSAGWAVDAAGRLQARGGRGRRGSACASGALGFGAKLVALDDRIDPKQLSASLRRR